MISDRSLHSRASQAIGDLANEVAPGKQQRRAHNVEGMEKWVWQSRSRERKPTCGNPTLRPQVAVNGAYPRSAR